MSFEMSTKPSRRVAVLGV